MAVKVNDKEHRVAVNVYAYEKEGMYPYVILTDDLSHTIAAYYSFKQDMNESKQMIEFITNALVKKELPDLVISSIFNAAVIKYMRCFSYVDSGRKKKLVKDKLFKNQSPKLLKVHEEIEVLRNFYIAHAQKSQYESFVMVAHLIPAAIEKKIASFEFTSRSYSWNESLLVDFTEVISFVISKLEKMIKDMEPKYLAFKETLDLDELYAKSKTQHPIFWFDDHSS